MGKETDGGRVVEILELLQASLTITAVTLAAVAAPVAIMTDSELPDVTPLIELHEEAP